MLTKSLYTSRKKNMGLFNQLMQITLAIAFAHHSKAKLFIGGFNRTYNKNQEIPISKVLHISKLNRWLKANKFKTQVKPLYRKKALPKSIPKNLSLRDTLKTIQKSRSSRINLGAGLLFLKSLRKQDKKGIDLLNFRDQILNSLPFHPEFYRVVNKLTTPPSFDAVHLRIENDILKLLKRYPAKGVKPQDYLPHFAHKFISKLIPAPPKKKPLFIASALPKSDPYIRRLSRHYQVFTKPGNWRKKTKSWLPSGREIDAIIDYLICLKADSFLGTRISTFSIYVAQHLKAKGKKVVLVDRG